jgi:outer membrane protein TolC
VLSQRENALRQQIGADLDAAIRDLPISLTEPLAIPVVAAPEKTEAVRKAMAARPDRLALAAALDSDDIGIRRATEALRPSVSLVGQYETQGVGGTYLATASPGGLGDALNQMFHFSYPVYAFGLRMKLPIRDHAGTADLADAEIRKKSDALALRKLEQTLRRQVLDAVDNVEAARASLDQAQLARDYASKRFESEQKKYELGITQLFFVQQSQTDFNSTEFNVLEQNINYRRNLVNLYSIMGQLLDERGITLD